MISRRSLLSLLTAACAFPARGGSTSPDRDQLIASLRIKGDMVQYDHLRVVRISAIDAQSLGVALARIDSPLAEMIRRAFP